MSEQAGDTGRGWRGRHSGWDPIGELQSLRAELSRLVGNRSGPPEVELTETAEGWEVVVRLPGVAPEEVAVELDDRELCVRARSEAEVNADHGIPGGMETRGFEYRVDLPSRVDPDTIDAVMDHGLLRVRLPRAARPAPRTITVGQLRSVNGHSGRGTSHPVDPAADRELHHPDVSTGPGPGGPSGRAGTSGPVGGSSGSGGRSGPAGQQPDGATGTGEIDRP